MTDPRDIEQLFGNQQPMSLEELNKISPALALTEQMENANELFTHLQQARPEDYPTSGISFSEEGKQASPALALAEELLNSGEDPVEFLNRRGIQRPVTGLAPDARERVRDYIDQAYPYPIDPDPEFPNRPQHPDFAEMAAIVRTMDNIMEETEDPHSGLGVILQSTPVDLHSMAYMANQRALRAEAQLTADDDGNLVPEREKYILLWLDAFLAGYRMAAGRAPSIEQVLDDSILDGQRRTGVQE